MEQCSNEAAIGLSAVVKEEPPEQPKQQAPQPAAYAMSSDSNNCTEEDEEAECTTELESEIRNSMSKCVLCGKILVLEDNAKLLECLHAACTNCINSKLRDQHGTSVDAEILGELLLFFNAK